MSRGVLAVVSGFSGAGKGTIMKSLMAKYDNYALSVSATTRNPRPGEEDGREYFFRTKEEFEQLFINAGFTDIQIHTRKGENWICVEGGKRA